jgi:hypothetical protein
MLYCLIAVPLRKYIPVSPKMVKFIRSLELSPGSLAKKPLIVSALQGTTKPFRKVESGGGEKVESMLAL